ncbi:MAG: signal recognition particle-docking protein FtsY [Propionibacteriaceae bacterium]|nr:signal recognition particle-docking protein FtsY [Propionibacteriaceae bacterium]
MPSELIFWIIVGVIVAALVAATVVVLVSKRKVPPAAPEAEVEVAAPPVMEAEAPSTPAPEPPASRLQRLRRKLSAAENPFAKALLSVLSGTKLDDEAFDDLEATLLTADLGVEPTAKLIEALRREAGVSGTADPAEIKQVLHDELVKLGQPELDRTLHVSGDGVPGVVLVVGVNGTGKTTTIGKLARLLVATDRSVLLGAADTFRAAAADQLQTWGSRVGVETVRGEEGADPASVAYAAIEAGIAKDVDTVVVDTAGRLHNKAGLMDELGKIKRVIEKQAPITEVLLVLDATTGQNGLIQSRVFAEVVEVTGIVLTKLDGSAKGGIVFAVQQELGVPVKLVGLGEGPDDLAPFDVPAFVSALLS